jgi:hypothetical protein
MAATWLRRGGVFAEDDFDLLLNSRGLVARLFRPVFRLAAPGGQQDLEGLKRA